MQTPRPSGGVAILLLALAAILAGGCSSHTSQSNISAGLDALNANQSRPGDEASTQKLRADLDLLTTEPQEPPTREQLVAGVNEQTRRQQEWLKQKDRPAQLTPPRANMFDGPPATTQPANSFSLTDAAPPPTSHPATTLTPDPAAIAEDAWSKAVPPPATSSPITTASPKTLEQQTIELAANIAGLLREPSTPDHPRMSDAAAIAAIESLRPKSIAELESPDSFLGSALSAQDRQTLIESRDRLIQQGSPALADLQKHITGISPGPTLTISRSALCTKVSGYGNYVPYPSTVFRAGSPIRAVVYIELENFITRAARSDDRTATDTPLDQQVSVDLTQSISLFQDPGGLLAWHSPPKPITDTSRSRRRDFYLIQQIELPRTLSIGRYNIKVQVKDRGNNAETEVVIPISVVAQ